jgi:hypothetical protein
MPEGVVLLGAPVARSADAEIPLAPEKRFQLLARMGLAADATPYDARRDEPLLAGHLATLLARDVPAD